MSAGGAVKVDPEALVGVSRAVGASARRLESATIVVRAAARGLADLGDPGLAGRGDPGLVGTARRMADLQVRVAGLARLLALVATDFATTEARVGAGFAAVEGPAVSGPAALWTLLDSMAPAMLATVLAGSPALARAVVDRPVPPGSTADRLRGVLASGEPSTVVLREARSLLSALPEVDRRRLALLYPGLVAAVASAPVADRFAASRVLISAEIARLRARLAGEGAAERARAERRLRWYDELLTGSVTLTRPDGSRLVRPHQVLSFDPAGDGRVAEVFGDLAVARHLAVYVPGTGTSLDRYAGNAERVSAFAAAAPDLAVVLWQNADFPDQPQDDLVPPVALWDRPFEAVQHQLRAHVLSAGFRDAADRAGWLLARDVEGLTMAAPGPAGDLTVLGHSYGGSIVGAAEVRGLAPDRVVHIASAGAFAADVRDYATGECGTRRFSLTVPDDPIQLAQGAGFSSADQLRHSLAAAAGVLPTPLQPLAVPLAGGLAALSGNPAQVGHGLDPDLLPSVTRLEPGVRADGHTLVSGHGGMFEPGSTAWRNLLAVMRGEPVQVMQPELWRAELRPVAVGVDGLTLPRFVVTQSPYVAGPGYQAPTESSVGPVCSRSSSW